MIDEFKKELQNISHEFNQKLKNIRSFKLSLSFLENLEIPIYHSKYPLKSLCHISQIDFSTFRLEPYDVNILHEIEVAILERKMKFSVIKEKNSLLVKVPSLTEEDKKEIVKSLRKLKEDTRIKARRLRDEFLKKIKNQKEEGKISEEVFYKMKENVDKEIEKFNKEVDSIFEGREKELLG